MCLSKVTIRKFAKDQCEVWYKVVARNNHPNAQVFRTPYRNARIRLGEWNTNKNNRKMLYINNMLHHKTYKNGFHFYDWKSAKNMVDYSDCFYDVIECIVTKITAKGWDMHGKACVAQEFRAMRKVCVK